MKTFLSTWWERISSSYWFFPSLLALGAIFLSALTLHIDTEINPKWTRDTAWIWAGGAQGARNVLATIASSTITVAGVVFSITIVTLTLASSQFGPRLLRNFMSDRGTQLVLGVFVATFLYCLLVLRAIRGLDEVTVVPFLSVTCGVGFAVASVGFLIFFIHHIATSIIAENVIARVANDLHRAIDRLYPEKAGHGAPANEANAAVELKNPKRVLADQSGFIQAIGVDELLELAREKDLVLRLRRRPGEFVAESSVLAEIFPGAKGDAGMPEAVLSNVYFGRHRTPVQDIEYSIDQLVEVAVRALSPGINDPFTAISCVEWLGAGLIRVVGRKLPSRNRCDEDGRLRIITDATDFDGIANAAFNQLRQYGSKSVAVTIRILEVIGRIASHVVRQNDREILLGHAEKMREDGVREAANENDRERIERAFEQTSRRLAV